MLLGENSNPNRQVLNRALVSKVKFNPQARKREKKRYMEEDDDLRRELSANTVSSTSTTSTMVDKSKRREYQGTKVYRKQKGGRCRINTFKHMLKRQIPQSMPESDSNDENTPIYEERPFNLYNEADLPGFREYSLQIVDNDVDDDCMTDDEIKENAEKYCQKKLLEAIASALNV